MDEIYIDPAAGWTAAIFVVMTLMGWAFFRRWKEPYLRISSLSSLQAKKRSFRQRAASLPRILISIALALFVLAYIDPHAYVRRDKDTADGQRGLRGNPPIEGIAIYLALDTSKSMLEKLSTVGKDGQRKEISKIDLLKNLSKRFVAGDPSIGLKGRGNDLIGVITFARTAHVISPLTLDHEAIIKELDALKATSNENDLGTALGYAIFQTSNLIRATNHFAKSAALEGKPAYEIKSSVILMVTDGFQELNPADSDNPLRSIPLDTAMEFAKANKVKVYIVNIDPAMTAERYSDYRQLFKLLTELTGGKFFFINNPKDLEDIYREIDLLEKSAYSDESRLNKENLPDLYKRITYYPFFLTAGMAALFLGILLETTWLRRVP